MTSTTVGPEVTSHDINHMTKDLLLLFCTAFDILPQTHLLPSSGWGEGGVTGLSERRGQAGLPA